MILALVFQRPDVSKFLGEISADDFLLWADFYNRSPWGPTRDDQRQAVLLSYLSRAFGGGSGELPGLIFPYWNKETLDIDTALRLAVETESALEDDGQGGYRWKGGKRPQALIDHEEKMAREAKEREEANRVRMW
jgi:hypothetical protein